MAYLQVCCRYSWRVASVEKPFVGVEHERTEAHVWRWAMLEASTKLLAAAQGKEILGFLFKSVLGRLGIGPL
ncbi:hypothetical protein V6Z12_A04G168100 [Gossypium hirsutum]